MRDNPLMTAIILIAAAVVAQILARAAMMARDGPGRDHGAGEDG